MEHQDVLKQLRIKALASETRIEILRLLAEPAKNFEHQWSADPTKEGVCMQLIAKALGFSQPTVSRHLDILKQAGFITVQQHQKWSHCKRNDKAITEYLNSLSSELLL